jgi:hypothetical protein
MKIKNTEANGRIVFEVVNARRQGGHLTFTEDEDWIYVCGGTTITD